MTALFLKIINLSITASFLIVAVVVLRFFLTKSPKWVRYILWGMVALRLVLPFSFESKLSVLPNAQSHNSSSVSSTTYVSEQLYQSTANATESSTSLVDILSYVWIIGVVLMLLYMVVSYIKVRLSVRESVRLRDNIYACDSVSSPFVLGFFNPKIYLSSSLNEEQSRYIIAHEQTHIRHFDNVLKPLGFLILCVYWFNPLCVLAYALFVKDIELFCDESVVRSLDTNGKKEYSTALLDCAVREKLLSGCPLSFSEGNIKYRIKSVLKYKKPTVLMISTSLIVCALVLTLFMSNPISAEAKVKKEIITPQPAQTETVVATEIETEASIVAPTEKETEKPTEKPTEKAIEPPTQVVAEYNDYQYDDYSHDASSNYNDSNRGNLSAKNGFGLDDFDFGFGNSQSKKEEDPVYVVPPSDDVIAWEGDIPESLDSNTLSGAVVSD